MLQQMSEATLTLLLTMLALGAVIRFMPAAGRGRRGKKVRSVAVWAGIGLGMVSSRSPLPRARCPAFAPRARPSPG